MRHKQIAALLLSVILAVSPGMAACMQAFAAEENAAEENAADEIAAEESADLIPEEASDSGDSLETEDGSDPGAAAEPAASEDESEAETENAEAFVTSEESTATEEEPEQETENAASGVTEEEFASEVEPEAETEPEVSNADAAATDVQAAEAAKTAEAAKPQEPEDVYLPITVDAGSVQETGSYNKTSSNWDAGKLASLPVRDTDVSSASGGCVMLGLPGEYIAAQQAVLDRINEIRKEACEEGVTNPETGKPLTSKDYVPLKWSRELEEIARIRAAETSVTGDHKRTNGGSWQSVGSQYTYVGECVAWNYSRSATSGIEQWYAEKHYWLEGNANKSGHYTTLIRPAMRHVGGATFYSQYTGYPNATLVEFYTESGVDQSFVGFTGECIQMLEVNQSNLNGTPSILGTLTGVKNDEQRLFMTANAKYSSNFTAYTNGMLFLDGVNWTSSNSKIATVSGAGLVKAVNCGSATITATAGNGSSAKATFTVDHVLQKLPAKAATCTASGLTEGEKCTNCGTVTVKQETVPAKGHSYGSWKVTKKETCTAKGSRERACTVCGNKVTQAIAATGHKWETTYTVDKVATCTAEGSESIHCSVCDAQDSSTVRAIAKKAHSYGSWKVTKKATCTEKGSQVRTCKVCGYKQTKAIPKLTPGWKQDANGWKYLRPDTTYPKSQFEVIEGSTYYFNDSEYRVTGLQEIDGAKYYFNEDGVMQVGWQTIDGEKYYFDESGEMHIGWLQSGDDWYYFRLTGVMHTGTLKKDGKYYYFRKDGTRLSGWLKVSGKIYYHKLNGERLYGWLQKNGKKFYFKKNGEMHTGWLKLNGKYYYFKESGQMVTGRYKIGSTWFTFNANGVRQ